jgi:hypothetical protein
MVVVDRCVAGGLTLHIHLSCKKTLQFPHGSSNLRYSDGFETQEAAFCSVGTPLVKKSDAEEALRLALKRGHVVSEHTPVTSKSGRL